MQLQFIAGTVISDGGVSLKMNDNIKDSVYYFLSNVSQTAAIFSYFY